MRISDWSSDVCSSDLVEGGEPAAQHVIETLVGARTVERPEIGDLLDDADQRDVARRIGTDMAGVARIEIAPDRKSVVLGKRVSVRVDLGGRRIINKKIIKHIVYCHIINPRPLK